MLTTAKDLLNRQLITAACTTVIGNTSHIRTASDITQSVTAAIDMVDGTSHQLDNGLTAIICTIDCCSVRTETNIRTRICKLCRTGTITATEHFIDNLCTLDQHVRTRRSSTIATAIDFIDARQITTFDNHLSALFRFCCSRHIVCLFTATKDTGHIIVSGSRLHTCYDLLVFNGSHILVLSGMDMHLDVSFWCSVNVVGTKDVTQDNTSLGRLCNIVVQIHQHITAHIGGNR